MDLYPPKTPYNRLHEVQLRAQESVTRVPLIAQHRARRLAWCYRHRTWIIELLTDESCSCLWKNEGRCQGTLDTVFQQDNFRPHVTCRTLNSLTRFDILPWPFYSSDLNPIEHLWDLIRRDMNRGPLAQTVDDLRSAVDVA
ncbi:transposable element Tcb1 transposase [Trichonephila clavipes]|nr:transposable element Tcb1 transposase [Trichonephila clavipes]